MAKKKSKDKTPAFVKRQAPKKSSKKKAEESTATVHLKFELNKEFHIKVTGNIKGSYGAHIGTTGTTMRLAKFVVQDGLLEVKSKVHCAIKHIRIGVPPFGKLYIEKGRSFIKSIEQ